MSAAETLLLLLPDDEAKPLHWGRVASDGRLSAFGDLGAGADWSVLGAESAAKTIAIVPGQEVVCHDLDLPVKSPAQARNAARFAIEDDAASDASVLHVALAGAPPRRTAYAVHPDVMARWTSAIQRTGLTAAAFLPDYACLDQDEETWTVAEIDGRYIVSGAFTLETETARTVLADPSVLSGLSRIKTYTAEALTLTGPTPAVDADAQLSPRALLERMAPLAVRSGAPNLLQGPYAPRRNWGRGLVVWRRAAVIAVLVGAAYLLQIFSEGLYYKGQADKAYDEAVRIYGAAFPGERVTDPLRQLRGKLRSGGGDTTSFISLSSLLTESLQETEKASLQTLRYEAASAELQAGLSYEAFEDVETVRAALEERGAAVDAGGARQQGGRVAGTMVVRAQ